MPPAIPAGLPNNLTVLLYIASLVLLLLVAWLPSRAMRKDVKDVKEQVQNNHTETGLRDDLDRALEGVQALLQGQRKHDAEFRDIREAQNIAARGVQTLGQRLDDHLREEPRELARALEHAALQHIVECPVREVLRETDPKEDHGKHSH